jgi:hypothetical protein
MAIVRRSGLVAATGSDRDALSRQRRAERAGWGLVPFATVADMPVGLAGHCRNAAGRVQGAERIECDSERATMPAISRLWFDIARRTKA